MLKQLPDRPDTTDTVDSRMQSIKRHIDFLYLPVEFLFEDSVTANTEIAITRHQTVVVFIFLGPVVECRI